MGYCTNYELTIYGPTIENFEEVFTSRTDYNLDESSKNSYYLYAVKWYSWQDDMSYISSLYHNNYFYLTGDGEESDDFWHAYFYNGAYRVEQAILTYPEIDVKQIGNLGQLHPELFV